MCQWISVTERLPRNHRKVIIFDVEFGIDYGGWHTKDFGWLHSDGCKVKQVTHWMPMLKPPTGLRDPVKGANYQLVRVSL